MREDCQSGIIGGELEQQGLPLGLRGLRGPTTGQRRDADIWPGRTRKPGIRLLLDYSTQLKMARSEADPLLRNKDRVTG